MAEPNVQDDVVDNGQDEGKATQPEGEGGVSSTAGELKVQNDVTDGDTGDNTQDNNKHLEGKVATTEPSQAESTSAGDEER